MTLALMVTVLFLELGHNKQITSNICSKAMGTLKIENEESQSIITAFYFPDVANKNAEK